MALVRKIVAWTLAPLSIMYGVVVVIRNWLFNMGILKECAHNVVTISVGNISCGGTGKTPHVAYLLQLLADKYPTALVSRGYMRQSKGYVCNDGSNSAALLGDEPSMIARKFPEVTVAVCKNRNEAVSRLLQQEEPPQLVVLDDAYQHRFIKPSINILLTDYRHPYYSDLLLPFGTLREPRAARRRAQVIIVTKCPEKMSALVRRDLLLSLKTYPYQKVFFSSVQYSDLVALGTGRTLPAEQLSQVLLLTGIAYPKPIERYLKRYCKVVSKAFPDHHDFTDRDIAEIRSLYEAQHNDKCVIVTTEKDAARMGNVSPFGDLPIYVLPIKVVIQSNDDESFDEYIDKRVQEIRRSLQSNAKQ